MPQKPFSRLDVGRLILGLAILSAVATMLNSFIAGYLVERQLLIDNTLEDNRAYAAKLAAGTNKYFTAVMQSLHYSAAMLAAHPGDTTIGDKEALRLAREGQRFNSVVIADATGTVFSAWPPTLPIKSEQLTSQGAAEALRERRPLISQPYTSQAGNLMLSFSYPIVSEDGHYLGYVGGVMYLKGTSLLSELLEESYHQDGTYTFVIARNRQILYHPDSSRVGLTVASNPAIDAALSGQIGSLHIQDDQDIDMLAGYAPLPLAGWGIVVQRPTDITLKPLTGMLLQVLAYTLPTALVALVFIWWLARRIAQPLEELAEGARSMEDPDTAERIQNIRTWYYESAQLKRTMLIGIGQAHQKMGKLNLDAQTDPLTGLLNRRGITLTLESWQTEQKPFSVVALDIDHFKRVNDTFGHDTGDEVLRQLGQLIRSCSRIQDLPCRSGGEEFLLLLPDTPADAAFQVAERLRQCVEQNQMDKVGHITISLGVAHYPQHGDDPEKVLKAADEALYRAKRLGRNMALLAEDKPAAREQDVPPTSQ